MPDASGRFRGSGWSRAREDGWERAFANPLADRIVSDLAKLGQRVEDYPQDRWGRYVIPVYKRSK